MGLSKEKSVVTCCLCGADITRTMKFYDNKVNRYCYDCFHKISEKPKTKRKPQSISRKIKSLYYKGKKPSEIALLLGISAEEAYKAMNERR